MGKCLKWPTGNVYYFSIFKNSICLALASVTWLERCPIDQKVEGLIPGPGTYPGCGFDPWSGLKQGNR